MSFWSSKCPEMSRNPHFSQFRTFRDIGQWYDPTTYARDIIDTFNRARGFVRYIKTTRIMQNDEVVPEISHFRHSDRSSSPEVISMD